MRLPQRIPNGLARNKKRGVVLFYNSLQEVVRVDSVGCASRNAAQCFRAGRKKDTHELFLIFYTLGSLVAFIASMFSMCV